MSKHEIIDSYRHRFEAKGYIAALDAANMVSERFRDAHGAERRALEAGFIAMCESIAEEYEQGSVTVSNDAACRRWE